jgi:hypothetical protein
MFRGLEMNKCILVLKVNNGKQKIFFRKKETLCNAGADLSWLSGLK